MYDAHRLQQHNWRVLGICLVAPAVAALLRKVMPGQPSSFEILGVFAVLWGGVWVFRQKRRPPAWLLTTLLIWAYFQLFYAALAIGEDWRIAVVATLVRIAPMLMAPIAFAAVHGVEDLRRASIPAAIVAVAMLPVGIAVAFFGNDALPVFLQPIQELLELGRGKRAGVPGVSGVFSTFAIMAMSMLAVFYLCLTNIALAEEQGRKTTNWWLLATCALILIYLSTRRGAFMAALIGLAVYAVYRRRLPLRLIIPAAAAVLIVLSIEAYGAFSTWSAGRTELLFRAFSSQQIAVRVFGILVPLLWMWIRLTPWGTYLGFAGPEGGAFASPETVSRFATDIVEVGGAQLLAETGLIGLFLMPAVVVLIMWRLLRASRGLFCRRAVILLVTFQATFFALYYLKELTSMTGVSMAQLFFWASSGIAAALIDREQRERSYWRAVVGAYVARPPAPEDER